jgi:hypothetical protein
MGVSGHDTATGVRADLTIQDPSALEVLDSHYTHQTRLEWTFHFGGGARTITVPLRWTKFHRPDGTVQVVRNVVMRDLIAEAEREEVPVPPNHPSTPHSGAPISRSRYPETLPTGSPPAPSVLDPLNTERLWPNVLDGKVMVRPRYQNRSTNLLDDLRRQTD